MLCLQLLSCNNNCDDCEPVSSSFYTYVNSTNFVIYIADFRNQSVDTILVNDSVRIQVYYSSEFGKRPFGLVENDIVIITNGSNRCVTYTLDEETLNSEQDTSNGIFNHYNYIDFEEGNVELTYQINTEELVDTNDCEVMIDESWGSQGN